jgi:Uncharacterized protein conserved in bacteria (DUF2263)
MQVYRTYLLDHLKFLIQLQIGTISYSDSTIIDLSRCQRTTNRPNVAVVLGDAVDIALDWQTHPDCTDAICPVVNMANPRKPGGYWEVTDQGSEESFAQRSNLAQVLQAKIGGISPSFSNYPIPNRGGLYSTHVGRFIYFDARV